MSTGIVSVVQAGSVPYNRQACLEKAADLAADAARGGAQLVVFPEAFVSAYPKGLDFGARVGMRVPRGPGRVPPLFRERRRRAVGRRPNSSAKSRARTAITLLIGVIERDGGTLYCTVLFFAPDGDLLGKHRKLMPTAMERLIWGFGDGSTLPVVDTPVGRVGSVICWENYMPMLRMAMYAKGVAGVLRLDRGRPGHLAPRPCATSPSRAAASSSRPASTSGAGHTPRTIPPSRATTRRP